MKVFLSDKRYHQDPRFVSYCVKLVGTCFGGGIDCFRQFKATVLWLCGSKELWEEKEPSGTQNADSEN